MNAPHRFTDAKPASLAERILAGDLTGLPEHITDEEWRDLAQSCADCEDDSPLQWEIDRGRLLEAHEYWQRMARNERESMRRDGMSIEEGPLASAWFALRPVRVPVGSMLG